MFIAWCLIFGLCILIIKKYYIQYKIGKRVQEIPGPPPRAIIGNLFTFFGDQDHLWKFTREMSLKYYPIYQIRTPQLVVLNLIDPNDVEAVLTNINQLRKGEFYNVLKPWLKEGLLTSTGSLWKHRRRILTRAFHFSILQKYMQSLLEHSEKMIESLKHEKGFLIKDLELWVTDFTLNVICETIMGVKLRDVDQREARKYKNAVNFMGTIATYRIIRPWLHSDFIFSLTSMGRKQTRMLQILHNFSTKIINERKDFHNKTNGIYLSRCYNADDPAENNNLNLNSESRKLAMLDLLIALQRNSQIDDNGIREEVDTFIFEGYDTTAMALIHSLLLLAEHQDVQQRAKEEIDRVWEECEGNIRMAEIQKLNFVECCLKETLRLYPSVPFISRQLSEDLHLNNHVIPAGLVVNIHIYDMHRDPNYWPNPTVFDPDRFTPERSQGRHPFSYIPFSGGFRNCIGQKFAMLEIKSFIAYLLRHFKLESIDKTCNIKNKSDLVLRPANPLRIMLVPRNEKQDCS